MQGAWRRLAADDCERFALVWETKELIALNWSLTQFALSLVRPPPLSTRGCESNEGGFWPGPSQFAQAAV